MTAQCGGKGRRCGVLEGLGKEFEALEQRISSGGGGLASAATVPAVALIGREGRRERRRAATRRAGQGVEGRGEVLEAHDLDIRAVSRPARMLARRVAACGCGACRGTCGSTVTLARVPQWDPLGDLARH